MSNMTNQDWSIWLSSDAIAASSLPVPSTNADKYLKPYLYKEGRGTPKAQFFMTDDGINGCRGFWCPRVAIVCDTGSTVEIASWCNITEIEYN